MTNSYNKSPEISSLYFPHHRPIETHSLFPRKRNGSEDFTSKKNLFSGTLSSFSKCLQ